MSELPAVVLLDPNEGCLRIARTLRRRGLRPHALVSPDNAFIGRSRAIRAELLPPLPIGAADWLAALGRLGAAGPAVLVPGSDAASELLARERDSIPATLLSFERPGGAHLRLMEKASCYELAREAGVHVPWVRSVASPEELAAVLAEAELPCISKPVLSHLGKPLGHRTRIARDAAELERQCRAALADDVAMLVTEYVPGGEENLEAAVSVRTADGAYPMLYGRRKVRQWPLDFGVGSVHRSAAVPDTIAASRRLLDRAGFVGISVVELKRHAETDELVLIETNVRVPAGFGLGDVCGVDASWRLYATLAGLPLAPQPPQRDGVQAILPHIDALAVAARVRRRELGLGAALRSYRGTRDVGVLDLRDPGPAAGLLARTWRRRRDARLRSHAR